MVQQGKPCALIPRPRLSGGPHHYNAFEMRLLATADVHFNHEASRPYAEELIARMNGIGADVLLLVGDTAVADGESLEDCLGRFNFSGPKLFVPGNHELWTNRPSSYAILLEELPRRVRAMGWQWLSADPFVAGKIAIVGSLGWYDYSFARAELEIPRRFYQAKLSPGLALRLPEYAYLSPEADDVSPTAQSVMARWNDGSRVRLGRTDDQFLDELLKQLKAQLEQLHAAETIVAAIHCLPFAQLLPPPSSMQWSFARAFLGSRRIGELLLQYPNVRTAICGHSHWPAEARVDHIEAINIGSGYHRKMFRVIDL